MPSAIWSGSVGFGLVQVPVRIVTATRNRDVSFNQLEEGTNSRIRYRKVSDQTGEEVPADKIIKGYEISKGQYVVVDPQEIESLQPKAGHTIDIDQFIDLDQIDPLYFEQPYYLQPDEKGVKAYKLLVDVMASERKVAIGKVVMRSKERLVAIRPIDGVLCLETMRYADEVLDRDTIVPDDSAEPTEKERLMARQLVESLAVEKFDIDEFRDTYRDELLDLIERKAAGEKIVSQPTSEPPAKVLDLVAALEASLARAKDDKPADGKAESSDDDEAGEDAKPKRRRKAKAS
ncbi:MAG TPA: Ku protein [Acidimicrobiia bacterium]